MDPKNLDIKNASNSECAFGKSKDGLTCLTEPQLEIAISEIGIKNKGKDKINKEREIMKKLDCGRQTFMDCVKYKGGAYSQLKKFVELEYKPFSPKQIHWELTNFEIDTLQAQLAEKYKPEYIFLNSWYRDFMRTRKHDFEDPFVGGKNKKLGMIYNTDYMGGEGIHWISIFIVPSEKTFEVYDSYGRNIQSEPLQYCQHLSEKYNIDFETKNYNVKQQDYNTDECGVYALYFIWRRLAGATFEELLSEKIDNDKMRQFRRVFFQPKN